MGLHNERSIACPLRIFKKLHRFQIVEHLGKRHSPGCGAVMKHGGKDGDGGATGRGKQNLRGASATQKSSAKEQPTKKEVEDQSFDDCPYTSPVRKLRAKAPAASPPPCKRVKLSNSKESQMAKKLVNDSGTLAFSLTLTF